MKSTRIYLQAVLLALCFIAHPVPAQTVTLSTGASCAYTAIAIAPGGSLAVTCAGAPPVVLPPVVTPPPPPPPETKPAPPAGPNPFVAWKAEGLTMENIVLWRLGHSPPTAAEWAQAVAAGYDAPQPISFGTGPSGFPPGFDLTGTEGGTGVRNPLMAGQYVFSYRATRTGHAYWQFETNPSPPNCAIATQLALNGERGRNLAYDRLDFAAIAGQVSTLTIWIDGCATVAITVRYAE